ncbi:class I SAM-dependent methyltransferase [Phaeobacter inhibens]|uniref:class I SAM-dependent methyltransferase n=1 Tax=Phaeobacter inhibens TaxID=221822 RepID=UPI00248FE518|nr:class I SAM-dependent methyltransferase [Phaeobacter inhibens]
MRYIAKWYARDVFTQKGNMGMLKEQLEHSQNVPPERRIRRMLRTNVAQKDYYEQTSAGNISPVNSAATNFWNILRHRAMVSVSSEARSKVYEVHKQWLGDLSDKKVLELGAGSGCPISGYIAEHAKEYHAMDLSAMQLEQLKNRIGDAPNRRFIEGDFLDSSMTDDDYDVIYAHAVLHHFRYIDVALSMLKQKMKADARVISYDASQTWLPVVLLRAVFRPFQVDADWEFPFTGKTLKRIEASFRIEDKLGVFNKGKWSLVLGVLFPSLGKKYGDKLFLSDFEDRKRKNVIGSLHVSYLMKEQ